MKALRENECVKPSWMQESDEGERVCLGGGGLCVRWASFRDQPGHNSVAASSQGRLTGRTLRDGEGLAAI